MVTHEKAYHILARILKEELKDETFEVGMDEYAARIYKRGQTPIGRREVMNGQDTGGEIDLHCFDEKEQQQQSSEKISEFLEKRKVKYESKDSPCITFVIRYRENKEFLENLAKAEPTDGNVQIVSGEYAITHERDANPVLSTQGLGLGTGLLLYDVEKGIGGVANTNETDATHVFNEMLEKLEKMGGEMFVLGLTPDVDPYQRQFMLEKLSGGKLIVSRELNIVDKKTESRTFIKKHRLFAEIGLPSEFSFDTRTGSIYQHIMGSSDPTLEIRQEKARYMMGKLENQLGGKCTCVYEPRMA